MSSLPVIERELRVQARRPLTYYGRLGWGLAAVAFLSIAFTTDAGTQVNGKYVHALIHGTLAVMLLILAPLLAADTISRERREGTLGLLLLTPLSARDVVLGKVAAHLFRLFYFRVLMIPFTMLPVLLGGLGIREFLLSLAVLFSIMLAGLAAGMVASARCVQFGAALLWALVFSTMVNWVISSLALNGPLEFFATNFDWDVPFWIRIVMLGGLFVIMPAAIVDEFIQAIAPWRFMTAAVVGVLMLVSTIFFLWSIRSCSKWVALAGEAGIETARQAAFRRAFLTPIFWKEAFRRGMARKLNRNPFVWLEYRAAWSRAARTGVVFLLILAETLLIVTDPGASDLADAQFVFLGALLLFVTLKSSSSFQREKESGAFELILVTPITAGMLVAGRLRAVIGYYLPMIVTLLVFNVFGFAGAVYHYDIGYPGFDLDSILLFVTLWLSVFSVPPVGLYFALRCKSFFAALLWTTGVAVAGPPFLWGMCDGLIWYAAQRLELDLAILLEYSLRREWLWPLLGAILYHLAAALFSRRAARELLRRRAFGYTR